MPDAVGPTSTRCRPGAHVHRAHRRSRQPRPSAAAASAYQSSRTGIGYGRAVARRAGPGPASASGRRHAACRDGQVPVGVGHRRHVPLDQTRPRSPLTHRGSPASAHRGSAPPGRPGSCPRSAPSTEDLHEPVVHVRDTTACLDPGAARAQCRRARSSSASIGDAASRRPVGVDSATACSLASASASISTVRSGRPGTPSTCGLRHRPRLHPAPACRSSPAQGAVERHSRRAGSLCGDGYPHPVGRRRRAARPSVRGGGSWWHR